MPDSFRLNSEAFSWTSPFFGGCPSFFVPLIPGECSITGLIFGESEILDYLC